MNNLNTETFQKTTSTGVVLVDFYADWCKPCKTLAPILEELSMELPSITFAKLDVDNESAISEEHGIMSIPTLILFKDGKEVKRLIGLQQKAQLATKLSEFAQASITD